MSKNSRWANPLPGFSWSLPLGKYQSGGFGSKRKYTLHSGVDLLCNNMQPIAAVETGKIIAIENYGKNKTPWPNQTRVILIEGQTGVVAYCNVLEEAELRVGAVVFAEQKIGFVSSTNKNKTRNGTCVFHIELYKYGTKRRMFWSYNYPKPHNLLDPSGYLLDILVDKQVYIKRSRPAI